MRVGRSVEDATFVGGHHVLDVNEGILTTMLLEELKGALDEVSQDHSFTLAVLDLVSKVQVAGLEEVENGEDLSVVGYEGLTNSLRALDERLEDLEGHSNNLGVASVKGGFDRDDELRDDGEYLSSTLLEHVADSLDGKESVGVDLLTDAFEEDGEVVMVVELLDIHFPVDFVLGAVLNGNGQVSSVVEASEFRRSNRSGFNSTSLRSGDFRLFFSFV